jgi:phosphatidyl-myo-inositol dimannoside synthase
VHRVLLVTRNLPPLRGGMERLNLHLVQELAFRTTIDVVGPQGSEAVLGKALGVVTCTLKPLWRFLGEALFRALRLAREVRPSHVVAGSGLCAPIAWLASRSVGAQAIVYVHGLDIVTDNQVYQRLWLPFIRRCDVCIANSANTARLAREAGVPAERIRIVNPGVTLPMTAPEADAVESFRTLRGWQGRRVLLCVGRLTERKGLLDFVRDVLPRLLESDPGLLLAVVGNDAPDALLQGRTGIRAAVTEYAAVMGFQDNVAMYGELTDEALNCAYAAADVAVFPVKTIPGDVEGFGMVAIEAAAQGLPTVAYAVGGVPDAIDDGVSGLLVPAGDSVAFAAAVNAVLARGRTDFADGCRAFAQRFAWSHFGDGIRRAMDLSDDS